MLAAVGRGEMRSIDVVRAVHPDVREEKQHAPAEPANGWFELEHGSSLQFKVPGADGAAMPIRGLRGDLPVRFAPNGGALPGDRIVGILQPGKGITIYPIQSPALKEFDEKPERWLDVRWDVDPQNPERFPVRIKVTALNEPGTLGQIAQVIGQHDGNIDNVTMLARSPDFHEMLFDLSVFDLKHLTGILAELRERPVVSRAERVNG